MQLRGRRRKDEPQAITKRESEEAGEREATRGGGIQIDQQCIEILSDSSTSVWGGSYLVLARTLLDYVGVGMEGACAGVFPSRVRIAMAGSINNGNILVRKYLVVIDNAGS
jgi:hypothetical protein